MTAQSEQSEQSEQGGSTNSTPAYCQGVAVAVAVDADGPLCSILLLGEAGIGKSAIALNLIQHCPWQRSALLADDVVHLRHQGGQVLARSPSPLKGVIEVRGLAPLPIRTLEEGRLCAVFRCVPTDGPRINTPRYWPGPEEKKEGLAGLSVSLPCVRLSVQNRQFADSAARLRVTLRALISHHFEIIE